MAYQYNDYFQLTKNYLRNLNSYKECISEMEQQVKDLENAYASVPIKSPSFDSANSGSASLNSVESETQKRLDTIRDKYSVLHDMEALKAQVTKIENARMFLTKEEDKLFDFVFLQNLSYSQLARVAHLGERTCKRKINAITRKIAVHLFGRRAERNVHFINY